MAELLNIVRAGAGALACLLAGATPAQPVGVAERFGKDVDAQVERNYAGVESLYKDIHAAPELAFEEVNYCACCHDFLLVVVGVDLVCCGVLFNIGKQKPVSRTRR